jgi:4-amino-4-deoxy-L-arabinose transferase-like glycosyltransferase
VKTGAAWQPASPSSRRRGLAITALFLCTALALYYASGFRTAIDWDIIDIAIGRNLLYGRGFVDFPGAPAAVWRNPLTPIINGLIWAAAPDPYLIFRIVFTAFLTGTGFVTFLWTERAHGLKAALIATLIFVSSPAVLLHLVGVIGSRNTMTQPIFMFFAISGTYLASLAAHRGGVRYYLGAGTLLGFAYLARTDGLFYLGAILCWFAILKIWFRRVTTVPLKAVALCVLVFLVVATPWILFLRHRTGTMQVNGQAIYAFYASEGWVRQLPGDTEDAGFQLAKQLYGTPEDNHFSILSAIQRNPSAFGARLKTNAGDYFERFFSDDFLPVVFVPFIVLGLVSSIAAPRPDSILAVLVLLPNFVYLVFQPDPRYLTHNLPAVSIVAALGILWPADLVRSYITRSRVAATAVLAVQSIVALALLGISVHAVARTWRVLPRVPDTTEKRLGSAIRAAADRKGIVNPIVLLPPVGFPPLVAFYADARLSWGARSDAESYPRATIFSMVNYSTIDLLVASTGSFFRPPDDSAVVGEYLDQGVRHFILDGTSAVVRSYLSQGGQFFVLDGTAAGKVPTGAPAVTLDEVRLVADDKVRCQPGGFAPDGKGDLMFHITVRLLGMSRSVVIARVEIARDTPIGIWQSQGPHFVVGVAESPGGALINAPGGDMASRISGGTAKSYWLYTCHDLPGLQEASFAAVVYLADDATPLVSEVLRTRLVAR